MITDAARRRLGIIREVLHELTTPKFGKREIPRWTCRRRRSVIASCGIADRPPAVGARNPSRLQARRQTAHPGRRRQRAAIPGAVGGAGGVNREVRFSRAG